MSGTQVQNVSVVSVLRAVSISDWGICDGACGAAAGVSVSPPLHAARNQALEAAAAVEMRNLRLVNGVADIVVLSNRVRWMGNGNQPASVTTLLRRSSRRTGPLDLRMISSVPGRVTVPAGGSAPSIIC